jgi:hypothetical protein
MYLNPEIPSKMGRGGASIRRTVRRDPTSEFDISRRTRRESAMQLVRSVLQRLGNARFHTDTEGRRSVQPDQLRLFSTNYNPPSSLDTTTRLMKQFFSAGN